jgi:hypothetical protein
MLVLRRSKDSLAIASRDERIRHETTALMIIVLKERASGSSGETFLASGIILEGIKLLLQPGRLVADDFDMNPFRASHPSRDSKFEDRPHSRPLRRTVKITRSYPTNVLFTMGFKQSSLTPLWNR